MADRWNGRPRTSEHKETIVPDPKSLPTDPPEASIVTGEDRLRDAAALANSHATVQTADLAAALDEIDELRAKMERQTVARTDVPAAVAGLPAIIVTAIARLDEERAGLMRRIRDAADAEAVAAQFPALNPHPYVAECSAYLDLSVDRVEDCAGPLRALSALGYRCGEREDDPRRSSLVWRAWTDDGRKVYVNVTLTGAACRFVEVGKKEVPVYEIRCEQAAAAQGSAS